MSAGPQVPGPRPDAFLETSCLPLSHGQEALWFLQQLHPQSPVYTEAWSVRIAEQVVAPVLERSLNELVRRHDILRTRFEAEGGRPRQVTLPAAELTLRVEDLTCLPATEHHAALERLIDGETAHVFDLATAPLLRALLVRTAQDRSVLVFSMHHIVCDGVAAAIFASELQAIYVAYAAGQPSCLAELPLQFPAHAASERRRSEQRANDNLRYWEQLLGDAPVAELVTDRPRPPVQSFRGASETARISDSVASEVDALAARENVTAFMVYLAAFQILLHRYTGESDIVTGAPIADRPSAEADRMIGMFVNMTLFRIDLSGDPSAAQAVARVREAVIEAFAHRVTPFERLVKSLRPQRDLSRNPLFQIAFSYERRPASAPPAAGVWSPHAVAGRAAKFDLTLIVEDEPEGRRATVEYCTELFERDTMRRLIRHYQSLLEAIGSEPETRISELSMLSEPELHQLLVEWNSSGASYRGQSTVHGLFREQVRRAPHAVALVDGDDHLTYSEVDRRSDRLAGRLAAAGIGPEDT
ncbi:condensation domain-containing protein, partial [Mesorhizobium mediterraneum]|uniref:condensation domain-containing protein n=1 Tax=Mesorhizobium mediterraneum TaxID=43617 RepID=UPI001FEEC18D